jgi:hypothetical protein
VLDLDSSKAIELLLVAISDKAKRIEKSERRLGSKLVLEAHLQGRGAAGALGRSKGGSASNEGGKNSSLHVVLFVVVFVDRTEEGKLTCDTFLLDLRRLRHSVARR